jgi:hypothetical protein
MGFYNILNEFKMRFSFLLPLSDRQNGKYKEGGASLISGADVFKGLYLPAARNNLARPHIDLSKTFRVSFILSITYS